LSREAAPQLALGESDGIGTQPVDPGAGPLAKRELEAGRLVAEGLSNKQIGARLFISDRTVAAHISNIMNKLGLNSRAQIAGITGFIGICRGGRRVRHRLVADLDRDEGVVTLAVRQADLERMRHVEAVNVIVDLPAYLLY
jgi:DNA-binding CsgD family transcriptional regulator